MTPSCTLSWSRRRSRWVAAAVFGLSAVAGGQAQAVEIEPLRLELTGAPGQTVTGTLAVTNRRAEAVRLAAKAGAYRYVFTAHTVPPQNPHAQRLPSCEAWLVTAPETLVEGGATATLSYTVTIPADAQPPAAEYVAALLVDERPGQAPAAEPPGDTPGRGTVTILPRIAIPVYVFLAGHDTPQGRIAEFRADAGPQPGITRLLLTLANDGEVHVRPTGTVLVTDLHGAVVSRTPLGRTIPIFPRFQEGIPLLLPLAPGRYTAVATVQLGPSGGQTVGPALLQQNLAFTVTADGRVQTDR